MTDRPTGALRDLVAPASAPPPSDTTVAADTLDNILTSSGFRDTITGALGPNGDTDRFIAVCRASSLDDPLLLAVPPTQLANQFIRCASIGLEPNTPLEHLYLRATRIPGATGHAAEIILGYRGMIQLGYRSGQLETLEAVQVCKNDDFEFEKGTDGYLRHTYDVDADRGPERVYYGIAKLKDAERPLFWIVTLTEIDRHRDMSPNGQDRESLWYTNRTGMALKTVYRIMFPYLPVSTEALAAVSIDGTLGDLPELEDGETER